MLQCEICKSNFYLDEKATINDQVLFQLLFEVHLLRHAIENNKTIKL